MYAPLPLRGAACQPSDGRSYRRVTEIELGFGDFRLRGEYRSLRSVKLSLSAVEIGLRQSVLLREWLDPI